MEFVIFDKGWGVRDPVQVLLTFAGRRCLELSEESREPPLSAGQEHSTS